MKIASWNIGGAHIIKSDKEFDYEKEDLDYFVQNFADANADLIFLQETHMPRTTGKSLSERIAQKLGYRYFYDTVRAPISHIDQNYQYGLSMISRRPLLDFHAVKVPSVNLDFYFSDGRKGKMFDQYLQIAQLDGVNIFHTHLSPIQNTHESWTSETGRKYAERIDKFFCDTLRTPMIFAGDFNAQELFSEFPKFTHELALADALPPAETNIVGEKVDYILYSPELKPIQAKVVETNLSDHYLLEAKFSRQQRETK
jgi:endonuclease/exonuclease/phosphatase family metal-dependent hydrolase